MECDRSKIGKFEKQENGQSSFSGLTLRKFLVKELANAFVKLDRVRDPFA